MPQHDDQTTEDRKVAEKAVSVGTLPAEDRTSDRPIPAAPDTAGGDDNPGQGMAVGAVYPTVTDVVRLRHDTDPHAMAEILDARVPGAVNRSRHLATETDQASGDAVVKPGAIVGVLYDPDTEPAREELADQLEERFLRDFLALPTGDGEYGLTDCSSAVATEAIAQGHRPTGPARIESVTDHPDGLHKVVRWAVPVKSFKPNDDPDVSRRIAAADDAAERDRRARRSKAEAGS